MFDEVFHISVEDNSIHLADLYLQERIIIGTFDASTGGSIDGNNIEMDFSAESIVKADNSDFSGSVQIFASTSDPLHLKSTRNNGSEPAENSLGNEVSKFSFMNLQVELQSTDGSALQVKDNHTVKVKIPLQAAAPSHLNSTNIVLLHYDEIETTWKEEATGEVVDGFYQADIAHFSSWTWCEILSNPINLSGAQYYL